MGWRPIVKSWLNEMPASLTEMHKSTINDLFERFCDACIQLVRKGGVKELCPTTDTNMIKSLMNLMDCQMDEFQDEAKISQMEEREIMTWLEVCYFAFSYFIVYKRPKLGAYHHCLLTEKFLHHLNEANSGVWFFLFNMSLLFFLPSSTSIWQKYCWQGRWPIKVWRP